MKAVAFDPSGKRVAVGLSDSEWRAWQEDKRTVMAAYQFRHRILGRRWLRFVALAAGVGAVVAVLLAAGLR